MRPIYALLISIGLLASVYNYVAFANRVRRPPVEIQVDYAQGEFSIEIERSFDCQGDPIFGSPAIKVLFKGETVFENAEPIASDQSIVVSDLQGVEAGENEIFVSANQQSATSGLGAMKINIKRNGIVIANKVITSEPGLSAVSGPIGFTIGDSSKEDSHQH